VVSYQMNTQPRLKMVGDMLRKALGKLGREEKPLLHSDQGWQGGFNRSSQHQVKR